MKNSQKGFVVPLLITIIAVLVIGGGVYVYETKKVETPAFTDMQVQQSNQFQQSDEQNTVVKPVNQNVQPPVTQSTVKPSVTVTGISIVGNNLYPGSRVPFLHFTIKATGGDVTIDSFIIQKKGTLRTSALTKVVLIDNDTSIELAEGTPFNQYDSSNIIKPIKIKAGETKNFWLHSWVASNLLASDENKYATLAISAINTSDWQNVKVLGNWEVSSQNMTAKLLKNNTPAPILNGVTPYVSVLYPNTGEVLNNGGRDSIATVRWTTSNFGDMNITIGLLNKNGDWIKTIASDIPNTGNYNWRMDQTIASGEYKIAVTSPQSIVNSTTGPVASDISDGAFVINTRSITAGKTFVTLISPNGGEVLNIGDKVIIKWSSLGEKPTSATISLRSSARCPYSYSCTPLPNSFTNITEISGNDLDKGEYQWTVSKSNVDSHGNGYLIGIMIVKDNLDNANYDDSDSSFIIN